MVPLLKVVSDVSGSLLGAEGCFRLFNRSRLFRGSFIRMESGQPKMHFMSDDFVCVGAHFSAIWIVSF